LGSGSVVVIKMLGKKIGEGVGGLGHLLGVSWESQEKEGPGLKFFR
jgi:hypothetical protein